MIVPGSVIGGGAVAAVAHRQREILDAFRAAKATIPERAIPAASVPHHDHAMFKHLEKRRIIVRTPRGTVYLDEAAEASSNRAALWIVLAILVAGLIAVAWTLGLRNQAP